MEITKKIYTVQEMRKAADMYWREIPTMRIPEMLQQAADMRERCDKIIETCSAYMDHTKPEFSIDRCKCAEELCEQIKYIIHGATW